MKALQILVILATVCYGQVRTATGPADTKGACSPANTGNNNTFTINCGIGRAQGEQLLGILNRIIENQLDPEAVMGKLDEILKGVGEIKQANTPRHLSDDQKRLLISALRPFRGQKATVSVTQGDPDAHRYAQDFAALLREAGFELIAYAGRSKDDGVNPLLIMGGAPPVGVIIQPKDEAVWKTPLLRIFDQALTMAKIQHSAQYSGGMSRGGDLEILIGAKPIQ